ncbi:MAG: hypothetical protein JXQ72_08570 [Anaerolineae bacterium]|nr:hypothetical protein [Anaerolineae bacterium]
MQNKNLLIYPLIFALILAPVFIVALITYRPGDNCNDCNCAAFPVAAHSHGVGLITAVQDDMQLIFNVSAGATLYQIGDDGGLELCGGNTTETDLKHITIDVNDARLALGERLPVSVELVLRNADSGAMVLEAAAPAMYAPGHGYHFGDNYLVPPDTTYAWTVTISPVQALRQAGAQNVWLTPVIWEGTFTLDAAGNVVGKDAGLQPVGDWIDKGLHVSVSMGDPVPLYDVTGSDSTGSPDVPSGVGENARYFVVDVTDHAVNYEEKLPGADVTLHFAQAEAQSDAQSDAQSGGTTLEVTASPVISPVYGFHYGANVALAPGTWTVKVTVSGLDFVRHAGAALSLAREPVSKTFVFTVE